MRIYELTIILEPNLDKEAVNSELDKLTDMVKKADGTVFEVQHLGMRRLTFEMSGNTQGNYYTIYFNAVPEVLTQMDKSMKLNESVLRSMTIVLKQSIYEASSKKKSDERRPAVENTVDEKKSSAPDTAAPKAVAEEKTSDEENEKTEADDSSADDSGDDQEDKA